MMTPFQVLVSSLLQTITEVLPLGASLHERLLPAFFEWPSLSLEHQSVLLFGISLGVFGYFCHDWASILSRLLQMILFRNTPRTLDECLPFFFFLSSIPVLGAYSFFLTSIQALSWTPFSTSFIFILMGFLLWSVDHFWNRHIKNWIDWRGFDAFIVGLTQASAILPGSDPLTGLLIGAFFLHYKRGPALQYAYFCLFPSLLARTGYAFYQTQWNFLGPLSQVSGWIALLVGFFVSFLTVGGLIRHVQSQGFGKYFLYRLFLFALIGIATLVEILS